MHKLYNKNKYGKYNTLYAVFDNIDGINISTKVKIGGLDVGEISNIKLNDNYKAEVELKVNKDIKIPLDSALKISTSGIIGNKYLKLEIGGDEEILNNNEYFEYTQSSMNLEDLISRFLLNKVSK